MRMPGKLSLCAKMSEWDIQVWQHLKYSVVFFVRRTVAIFASSFDTSTDSSSLTRVSWLFLPGHMYSGRLSHLHLAQL